MVEFFEIVANIAVLVFVITCMMTAGLGLAIRDVLGSFRNPRLLATALVLNFCIAPAAAWSLTRLFAIESPYATGLLMLSAAAGAPFLPKLAQLAKGDVAYSVGLMLLLTIGTVVLMPVLLSLLIPGQAADPWPILRSLLFTMMLPLGAGMMVQSRSRSWAGRIRSVLGPLSNIAMILAVVVLVGLYFQEMIGTLGSGAVAVAVLFVSIQLAFGYTLGGSKRSTRSVLGLGTGQRNVAAALIVATQNASEPKVVVMLIAATLFGLVVLVPAAVFFARQSMISVLDSANGAFATSHEEVLR